MTQAGVGGGQSETEGATRGPGGTGTQGNPGMQEDLEELEAQILRSSQDGRDTDPDKARTAV